MGRFGFGLAAHWGLVCKKQARGVPPPLRAPARWRAARVLSTSAHGGCTPAAARPKSAASQAGPCAGRPCAGRHETSGWGAWPGGIVLSCAWRLLSAAPQADPSMGTPWGRPGRQTLAGDSISSAEVFTISTCIARSLCAELPASAQEAQSRCVCMRQQQGKQSKQLYAILQRLLTGLHGCAIHSCIRDGASHLQVQTARHRGHQPLLNLTMLA